MSNTVHEQLIEEANDALNRLYSDTSVSKQMTLNNYRQIMEDMQIRCEALQNSIDEDEYEQEEQERRDRREEYEEDEEEEYEEDEEDWEEEE